MNSIAAPSLFLSYRTQPFPSTSRFTPSISPTFTKPGICTAVQTSTQFLPTGAVIVREAQLQDAWQIADTHCSAFYPHFRFPLDLVLKLYRAFAMLNRSGAAGVNEAGLCASCLVAVREGVGMEWGLGIGGGGVVGVITVDNVGEFLPRRGPFKERRKGIAYISNVAVRQADRRQGIATQLVSGAETLARAWGCRSVALHCDKRNAAAVKLYERQGFRRFRVPDRAQWPEPRAPPGTEFAFMMKLVKARSLRS